MTGYPWIITQVGAEIPLLAANYVPLELGAHEQTVKSLPFHCNLPFSTSAPINVVPIQIADLGGPSLASLSPQVAEFATL